MDNSISISDRSLFDAFRIDHWTCNKQNRIEEFSLEESKSILRLLQHFSHDRSVLFEITEASICYVIQGINLYLVLFGNVYKVIIQNH